MVSIPAGPGGSARLPEIAAAFMEAILPMASDRRRGSGEASSRDTGMWAKSRWSASVRGLDTFSAARNAVQSIIRIIKPSEIRRCNLDSMRRLVEALCSDECAGRAPGTPGGLAARRIVMDAFREAGLAPQEQKILAGANVLATVPGATDRWVMVAA